MSKRPSAAAVEERPADEMMSTFVSETRLGAAATAEEYRKIPIAQLVESPFNPRKTFHEGKLHELAQSVRVKGIVEPIVVRPLTAIAKALQEDLALDGAFEIVAGARRYRAAKLAGLTDVPAIVREYSDAQTIEIMAIENGQRDDVPPLEEAAGYQQLLGFDKAYSAAMIAQRIGHTEKYVWDRLRLLELVPEMQEILTAGEIGVEHAEIIAKLKPAEQRALLKTKPYSGTSGLFEPDNALAFEDDPTRTKRRKPVSVRQLKQYIAEHVRLDITHAAAAAPLEFGETKQRVDEALAQPGRGRKVIPITFSHTCPDGAKDPDERTYGATAWKKAENAAGEKTCDYAVLGLVVAGEQQGKSFHVCIARDRCRTHWKESVEAKEKAAKLRESGKSTQAAKVEKKAEEKQADKWERERREAQQRREAWTKIETPVLADAVAQARQVRVLTPAQARALERAYDIDLSKAKELLGAAWFRTPAAALLVAVIGAFEIVTYNTKTSGFDQFIAEIAKPFGLSVKKLEQVRDQHSSAAAAPKKAAKAKKGGKR